MARVRGRPVERKRIGIPLEDPAPDFGKIAQGFGGHTEGPIDDRKAFAPALQRALRIVKDQRLPALIDVVPGSR